MCLKLAFTLSNFQDKDLQANKRSYQRRVPKFEIPNIHIRALNGAWLLLLECCMGYRKETKAINSPHPEKRYAFIWA